MNVLERPGCEDLPSLARRARCRLLRMHYESRIGHLGGNLSAIDAMITLHHRVMGAQDKFILSKGHSAGALYVTLWSLGRLTDDDLGRFHQDDTLLSGHPPARGIPDIRFATGSLGHGLLRFPGGPTGDRFSGVFMDMAKRLAPGDEGRRHLESRRRIISIRSDSA